MEKMLIYKLWEYACNGDIEKLKQYYSEHNEVNKRFSEFIKDILGLNLFRRRN